MTTKASRPTLTSLRTSVRRLVGDIDTRTTNQRWLNADIDEALNFELLRLHEIATKQDIARALWHATMTYTAAASGVDLPAAATYETLYQVEDVTTSTRPVVIPIVPPSEIMDWNGGDSDTVNGVVRTPAMRCSVINTENTAPGPVTSPAVQLVLRPIPQAAVSVRLTYVSPPFVLVDASDTMPLSARWQEVLCLGAAVRLREPFGSAPPEQVLSYQEKIKEFRRSAEKALAARPQRKRRGRS